MSAHRCGFVALLGRPNAGKSQLLNALLGEKLAIVSAKAQTTRARMLGVLSRPEAQILLHDTPGLHRGERKFNQWMNERALETAEGADLRLLLFEAGARWDEPEERVAALPGPLVLAHTKCDLGPPGRVPHPERFARIIEISALEGQGLEALVEALAGLLPEGPALFPDDTLTDANMRFLGAEQIREVVYELYRDEIPYAVAVEIDEWKESDDALRIRANLLVERESQKGIVVGHRGAMVKSISEAARHQIEAMLGCKVYLRLQVVVDEDWTEREAAVRKHGFGLPED